MYYVKAFHTEEEENKAVYIEPLKQRMTYCPVYEVTRDMKESFLRGILPDFVETLQYKHTKTGNKYTYVTTVKCKDTPEICVLYRNCETHQLFLRPMHMFYGTITFEGKITDRFKLVQ